MDKEQIKIENDKKKEYLWGYKRHSRKAARLEAEIEEIRSLKQNPSFKADGMPAPSGHTDLSAFMADLDELENKAYSEGVVQIKAYKDIQEKIKELQDEKERDVLFYRYIKDLEFWDIAQKMGYSERQIHRLHGKGLVHLKITKD